jgi:hypothetical protein
MTASGPEQGVCETCKHLRQMKFTYQGKSSPSTVCDNNSTLDARFKYPDTGTTARPCAGWERKD